MKALRSRPCDDVRTLTPNEDDLDRDRERGDGERRLEDPGRIVLAVLQGKR